MLELRQRTSTKPQQNIPDSQLQRRTPQDHNKRVSLNSKIVAIVLGPIRNANFVCNEL